MGFKNVFQKRAEDIYGDTSLPRESVSTAEREKAAHDVVDVQPEELQHQYKEGDEERGDKRTYKSLYDEKVQFF